MIIASIEQGCQSTFIFTFCMEGILAFVLPLLLSGRPDSNGEHVQCIGIKTCFLAWVVHLVLIWSSSTCLRPPLSPFLFIWGFKNFATVRIWAVVRTFDWVWASMNQSKSSKDYHYGVGAAHRNSPSRQIWNALFPLGGDSTLWSFSSKPRVQPEWHLRFCS